MSITEPTADQPQTAANEPKPGFKRVNIPASTFDVPIEPDALPDRVWSGVGGKDFDNFANELYAALPDLASIVRHNDASDAYTSGALANGEDADPDLAARSLERIEAYTNAILHLRCAAKHLRDVRIGLSPYVSGEKLTRGY